MKHSILPEDIFTLIYTSGTTGPPKGVMLTHENIVSNFISTSHAHPYGKQDRTLSFLPLSHIYERMMNYHLQYKGISIYYAENMATIAENLKEVQPKLIITVPRLLEKMYDKIIGKGKELPFIKRKIFFWAVDTGLQFSLENKSWFYKQKLKIAKESIFIEQMMVVGENQKFAASLISPNFHHLHNWAYNNKIEFRIVLL